MRQQVLCHVGARREARGLPCQMLHGGGSGMKMGINFLPAISRRGQTARLPFCHPVIDIKSLFCFQGKRMQSGRRWVRNFDTRNTDGYLNLPSGRGSFLLIHSLHFTGGN